MPAYHLILHTYGSWMPDRPEGYNERKDRIKRPPNANLAEHRRFLAGDHIIKFSPEQQIDLLNACKNSGDLGIWKVHAVAVVDTHLHVLLSWKSAHTPQRIQARLKQQLTYILNSKLERRNGQWFGRGAGISKIDDLDHLIELVKRYIPQHGEHVWIADRILSEMQ